MDKSRTTSLAFSALLAGAVLFCAGAARAEYRCDAPGSHFDRIACRKAQQGPMALRQFIHRIRSIESLYYYDYIDPHSTAAVIERDEQAARLERRQLAQARR